MDELVDKHDIEIKKKESENQFKVISIQKSLLGKIEVSLYARYMDI